MHRSDFIKTGLLAGIGINFAFQEKLNTPTTTAYLTGKKNPYKNYQDFLHFKAYRAFNEMRNCALEEGIDLKIVSGYRSFNRQLSIWNAKFERFSKYSVSEIEVINKVAKYSAIPGTSRHHWGTEIDIIDNNPKKARVGILNSVNYAENGAFYDMHLWLKENAHQFGYHLVYTDDKSRTGFKYEPWHYSYRPVSKRLLDKISKLNLFEIIDDDKISGNRHIGKNCLRSYFQTHLLGINPLLHP